MLQFRTMDSPESMGLSILSIAFLPFASGVLASILIILDSFSYSPLFSPCNATISRPTYRRCSLMDAYPSISFFFSGAAVVPCQTESSCSTITILPLSLLTSISHRSFHAHDFVLRTAPITSIPLSINHTCVWDIILLLGINRILFVILLSCPIAVLQFRSPPYIRWTLG